MNENKIGLNVRTYRDVVIRNSVICDNALIGDDAFITESTIGENTIIERRNMIFNCAIGAYCSVGVNDVIRYARIGKYCSIAWNCSIGGTEHYMKRLSTSFFPFDKAYGIVEDTDIPEIEGTYSKPVMIGNDVWIAAGAQVLRGVKVGDGAVLGEGTIVTKDVPPYEIWAGVPARKIGQRFPDEIIVELMEIKWWDFPIDVIKDNIDLFRKDIDMDFISELKSRLQSVSY